MHLPDINSIIIGKLISYMVSYIIDAVWPIIKFIGKLWLKVRRIRTLPDSEWDRAKQEVKEKFNKK